MHYLNAAMAEAMTAVAVTLGRWATGGWRHTAEEAANVRPIPAGIAWALWLGVVGAMMLQIVTTYN